jgi:hydroxymethylbilane synthase
VKTPTLVFGTLDASLARAQTQSVMDRMQETLPRVSCEMVVAEVPAGEWDTAPEPFLAWHRSNLAFLADKVRREECRAIVTQGYDLPVPLPDGIDYLCVPDRSTPFDALLNRQGLIMDELEPGSKVGVLCLRSKNQLECHWPDLDFQILSGGVDLAMETHLRRSEIDGLVLPAAITETLGIQSIVSEIFSPDFILPAPGQGALVILGAPQDTELAQLLAPLHSEPSARELVAEMAFRRHMISGVDLPIGVLARVDGTKLSITGATGCGTNRISVHGKSNEAEEAGSGLAQQLLSSPESFVDILEAEFPQGLPDDEDGDLEGDDFDDDNVENGDIEDDEF